MKWTRTVSTVLLLVVTFTTFSGAAFTAQAAEPHPPQRYEERDAHWNHQNDRHHKKSQKDRNREQRRLEKERESSAQKKADQSNRKANIALGIAAVATIIALSK